MKKVVLLILALTTVKAISAQSILNGSFENNTSSCGTDLAKASYNAMIEDSKEFGTANEVDVLGSSSCSGYGTAADGTYFIALVSNGKEDAISLKLSSALIINHTYSLSYSH